MRIKLTTLTAALVCACVAVARAQQPPSPTPAAALTEPSFGTIDFGFRGGTTEGDAARYERFRDLRNGAFTRIRFGKNTDQYMFSAGAENIGYHDQSYFANYSNGRARLVGAWDSIPLNYSYLTTTPWVLTGTNLFTLNTAIRTAVQNKVPGVIGVPQTAAQLVNASAYRDIASPFDLQSRRDTLSGRIAYDVTRELGFSLAASTTKRGGNQPFGMSFAFNNANELPIPINNRTNDFSAGLEWVNPKGMVRVGWDSSFFDNKIRDIVWDNPLRATDTSPFDASGYSNGNGSAQGRMSMPPSNSLNTVSTTALYKMPRRTTVNGIVSFSAMNQNEALIPWTINNVINSPGVLASFPGLVQLPRDTAEAKVHGVNAMFNLTSRPNRFLGLNMRYRFNDHRNLTPAFDATEYVRFDAVPEETGGVTENFNIQEHTLDVSGTVNVAKYTSVKVGYNYDSFNRTGRAFSDMTDHTLRTSVDVVGHQYLTVRGMYDHTARIGSGFSEASIEEGGAQPGLRFYDEADRDRDRGTLIVVANPISMIDLTVSMSRGKDVYKGEGHEFGLLDNDNTNFTVGVGLSPSNQVSIGANYGRDRFVSNQKSRNANPPPDPQFTDPSRDWTLKNDELVNNFDVYLDLPKAIAKTNIRVNYDYSDSDNGFLFGGPRIAGLSAIGQFIPLPNVTNAWHRLSTDVRYQLVRQVGVAFGYWYEKFDVSDFATLDVPGAPGTPRIDYLGEISTGYGNRPYKGNTVFVRMLYLF